MGCGKLLCSGRYIPIVNLQIRLFAPEQFDRFSSESGTASWHAYLLCMLWLTGRAFFMVALAAEGNIEGARLCRERACVFSLVFTPLFLAGHRDRVFIVIQLDINRYHSSSLPKVWRIFRSEIDTLKNTEYLSNSLRTPDLSLEVSVLSYFGF